MTVTIMENPSVNSPYEEPTRYCLLLSSGRYATARWGARRSLRVSIKRIVTQVPEVADGRHSPKIITVPAGEGHPAV